FAQSRCCSFWSRNLFVSSGTKRVNDFIHKLRIVRRVYRKRIAHFKAQSPSSQVAFEMACILCRVRPAQATIDQKFGGKRVRPRIRRGSNRSFGMHTANYVGLSSPVQISASLFKTSPNFLATSQ